MKKPIVIDAGVLRRLAAMPKDQRIECLLALCDLAETLGRPHLHTGLSIRKLTRSTFESWHFGGIRLADDLELEISDAPACLREAFACTLDPTVTGACQKAGNRR
ncbi:MAG: hypothetical protein ACYDH9_16865 [Limisphaerales bacterium]